MTKSLQVSPEHTLPVAMLGDSTLVLGRKRSGKSNNAVVIVEEALDLRGHVVILDPKGDWWGITSSFDGKSEGYPVVVIGGKHATLALNPLAGKAVADWVIDTGYSVIIDLSELEPAATERFCDDFLLQIRRRKEQKPGPILLVIDEADELAPQDTRFGAAFLKTLGRVIWMVKRGGFIGIGTLVITQRPASLNKNVTSQTEVLIVLNTSGSQDLEAIEDAVKHHIKGESKKERSEQLALFLRTVVALEKGEAMVVSGQMLKAIIRIPFRRRKTFDSGASPKFGEAPKQPKVVAKVALDRLSAAMEKAVAEQQANDPGIVKKKLADALAKIAVLEKRPEKVAPPKIVPALSAKDRVVLTRLAKSGESIHAEIGALMGGLSTYEVDVKAWISKLLAIVSAHNGSTPTGNGSSGHAARALTRPVDVVPVRADHTSSVVRTSRDGRPGDHRSGPRTPTPDRADGSAGAAVTPAQVKLLDSLAWLRSVGIVDVRREALAALSGVSPTSGSYSVNVRRLLDGALISYPAPNHVAITDAGLAIANVPSTPLTVDSLHDAIYQKIPASQGKILRTLIDIYPRSLTRAELADAVGVPSTSGSYSVNVSVLHDYGFVDYPRPGSVAAAPVVMLEGVTV